VITKIALAKIVTVALIAHVKIAGNKFIYLINNKPPFNGWLNYIIFLKIKNKMKKLFIAGIMLAASFAAFAQRDTTTVEQYCQVIATPRLLSNKVTIAVDFGDEKSVWKDNRIKDYDGRLKKFNTVIDALNYMGKDGWVFINAFPVRNGTDEIYHFAFKKLFLKSEVQD